MVLHRAHVIVQQRQGVACLDQKVIVHTSVLVVVDDGGKVAAKELHVEHVFSLCIEDRVRVNPKP